MVGIKFMVTNSPTIIGNNLLSLVSFLNITFLY
jgi:hypothetical protein